MLRLFEFFFITHYVPHKIHVIGIMSYGQKMVRSEQSTSKRQQRKAHNMQTEKQQSETKMLELRTTMEHNNTAERHTTQQDNTEPAELCSRYPAQKSINGKQTQISRFSIEFRLHKIYMRITHFILE